MKRLTITLSLIGAIQFANIAKSEQHHSALQLIQLNALEDPARPEVGRFINPDPSGSACQFILAGMHSLLSAPNVGTRIEYVDTIDLRKAIARW